MPTLTQRILLLLAQCLILALGAAMLDHWLISHRSIGETVLSLFFLLLVPGSWQLRKSWLLHTATHTLHAALEHAGLPLLLLDAQQGVSLVNASFLALDERNRAAHKLGQFGVAWLTTLERHFNQAMGSSGRSETEEILLKPDDGRDAMLLRICAAQLRDDKDRPCVLISAENLSAHNQTLAAAIEREHALRTRSQRYVQTLIDVIPQPVYVKDEEGRFVLVNQSFCARHNLAPDQLLGQALQILDADILRAEEALHEDLRVMAGTPIFREEHLRSADQDLYFIISKQSCEDPEGRRVLVGTQMDITPWRSAEKAVQDALQRETERRERTQAFIQRLLDVFPNPVCLKDAHSRYVMVNDAFAESRNMSRQDLLKQDSIHVVQYTVPLGSGLMEEAMQRAELSLQEDQAVLAGTPLRKEENSVPDQSGQLRDRIVTKRACEDPDGQPLIVVSMFDITDMRNAQREMSRALQAEKSLRERTAAFVQRLIDVIPHPVYVKNPAGQALLVNEAFIADCGRPRKELIGRTHAEMSRIAASRQEDLQAELDERARNSSEEDLAVLAGQPLIKEVSNLHVFSGQHRDRIVSKAACPDPNGDQVIVVAMFDVTELRSIQRELQQSLARETQRRERTQQFVQRLLDVLPYPVSIKNTASQYLIVNEAFAESRGCRKEDIVSKNAYDVLNMIAPNDPAYRAVATEHAQIGLEEDQAVLAGAKIRKETSRVMGHTGKRRDLIVTKAACEDPEGEPVIVVSLFDITEQREAQRELAAALEAEQARSERIQSFIQRLLDVIPEPVYVKDSEARYALVNDAFCTQRREPREAIVGKSARELAPNARIAAEVLAEDAEVLAGRTIYRIDDTLHPLTGQARWRIISKGSCLDPEGQPVIVGASFDITAVRDVERQLAATLEAEKDLRGRTQEFIQRLIDAVPIPIGVRNAASQHVQVNAAFLQETGLTREQIIGRRITDFVRDPGQIAASQQEDQDVLNGTDFFEEKQDFGLSGHDIRDLIISKRRCLDVDGQSVLVVAHIDVTPQREAERQALALMGNEKSLRQRTQNFIQRMIDVIPHPFFIKDQESRYILVNQAFLEETGFAPEALVGRSTLDISPDPDKARRIMEEDQRVLAGEDLTEERHEQSVTGGGEWADRVVNKRRCLDVDGKPVIAVLHLDVTEHRRIEHALQEALAREAAQRGRMQDFLQHVIDVLPQEFYIKDADSRVIMVNPVYLQRRGLLGSEEAIGKTAPEIGWQFLERNPVLQADPAALARAKAELQQHWDEAHAEDLEVLRHGKTILKKVSRRLPGSTAEHFVIIAKMVCNDPQGRPVIVCASYDLTELDLKTSQAQPPGLA